MNTQNKEQYTPALGGFFSWLKRAVQNVANAIIEISHNPAFIADIAVDIFDGHGFTLGNQNGYLFRTIPVETVEIPLNPVDEQKLDVWVQSKFLPYYKTFFTTLKQYSTNPPPLATFIVFYNNVQKFIGFLKWYKNYVLVIGEGSFSINALKARNQFFDVQIELLEADLLEFIASRNMSVNPANSNVNLSTNKYSSLGFNTPTSVSVNVLQIVANQSNSGQILINNTAIPIDNGQNLNNIIPNSETTDYAPKKSNGLVLFLLGVGIVLTIRKLHQQDE